MERGGEEEEEEEEEGRRDQEREAEEAARGGRNGRGNFDSAELRQEDSHWAMDHILARFLFPATWSDSDILSGRALEKMGIGQRQQSNMLSSEKRRKKNRPKLKLRRVGG